MSGYPWTPGETTEAKVVVEHMQAVVFEAEGARRTYWDFYLGFGLIVGAGLGSVALILWSLAPLAREHPGRAAAPTAWALVFMALNAWLSQRYFFLLPAAFAVVTVVLLIAALERMRKEAHGAS
jgi:hypothetical protein